jgi:hypothetical protein
MITMTTTLTTTMLVATRSDRRERCPPSSGRDRDTGGAGGIVEDGEVKAWCVVGGRREGGEMV